MASGTLRRSAARHRGSGSSPKILATPTHRAHLLPNFEQTRGGRGRNAWKCLSPPSHTCIHLSV